MDGFVQTSPDRASDSISSIKTPRRGGSASDEDHLVVSELKQRIDQPISIGEETVDVERLVADLRDVVRGEVRFDPGSRALYATDASNFRQVPIGVVVPRTREGVVATVEVCRRHGAPILPRGGGTSLAGQCCNVAVVIDCSKYLQQLLALDPERKLARVEPGLILDDLR
jgi:hypothetical protein